MLHLRYFLELPEREIAAAIGKPPGTVKSRLHRAGRRLRELIEKKYPELRERAMDDLTFERDVLAPVAARTALSADAADCAPASLTAIAEEREARTPRRRSMDMRVPHFAAVAAAASRSRSPSTLAVPSSRSAIASFFGVEGSKVERLPTPAPGETPTPLPAPTDLPSSARPASIEEAAAALGFDPALPSGAGDPQSVYLVDYSGEPVAILRYPDFDLWQAPPHGASSSARVPPKA